MNNPQTVSDQSACCTEKELFEDHPPDCKYLHEGSKRIGMLSMECLCRQGVSRFTAGIGNRTRLKQRQTNSSVQPVARRTPRLAIYFQTSQTLETQRCRSSAFNMNHWNISLGHGITQERNLFPNAGDQ